MVMVGYTKRKPQFRWYRFTKYLDGFPHVRPSCSESNHNFDFLSVIFSKISKLSSECSTHIPDYSRLYQEPFLLCYFPLFWRIFYCFTSLFIFYCLIKNNFKKKLIIYCQINCLCRYVINIHQVIRRNSHFLHVCASWYRCP